MATIFFSEIADIFPMMTDSEFNALKHDIKENGLLEPIEVYQGKIIDGRNRYRACRELGIEPRFVEFSGADPLRHIISKNLHRRHLGEAQRAMIAARIANMGQGERTDLEHRTNSSDVSNAQASKLLNVGTTVIKAAKKVIQRGTAELEKAVDSGQVAVSLAAKAAELTPGNQADFVDKVKQGKKPSSALREIRQEQRFQSFKTQDLPEGKYQVILADPPWQYEHHISDSRKIENQYPTMKLDEICNLKVLEICADSAVIFLWVPNPKLEEAFAVLKAWGFNYRTNAVWVKDRIGMGYYFRQRHELCLIATKGEAILPLPENRRDSVIESPRKKHSEKPESIYAIIEKMYPGLKKIEMFARSSVDGWDTWGNENV